MLALEHRAARRLAATATLTLRGLAAHRPGVRAMGLASAVADAVVDIRTKVRDAAVKQFAEATGLTPPPSGAHDLPDARRAGAALAKAYTGGGGQSGGGGSSDDWSEPDARAALATKIKRVAAWEVAFTWNDEHRRDADALPDYRFRERWCAILDHHLCVRCRRMNGRLADGNGMFAEGWPPLHPDCRCIVVTTVV